MAPQAGSHAPESASGLDDLNQQADDMEHFIFFTACLAGAVTGYLIASQVKSQKLASVLRPFFLALFFLLITAVDLHLPWNTPSIRESGWGTSTWLVLGLWAGRLLALAAFTRLAVSTEARPG